MVVRSGAAAGPCDRSDGHQLRGGAGGAPRTGRLRCGPCRRLAALHGRRPRRCAASPTARAGGCDQRRRCGAGRRILADARNRRARIYASGTGAGRETGRNHDLPHLACPRGGVGTAWYLIDDAGASSASLPLRYDPNGLSPPSRWASRWCRLSGAPFSVDDASGDDGPWPNHRPRRRTPHFTAFTISKIGRYIATIMPPTTTPRNTIITGSRRLSRALTAASTSSS